MTKKAAIAAGMKDVELISEPEAAAVYALDTLKEIPGSVEVCYCDFDIEVIHECSLRFWRLGMFSSLSIVEEAQW